MYSTTVRMKTYVLHIQYCHLPFGPQTLNFWFGTDLSEDCTSRTICHRRPQAVKSIAGYLILTTRVFSSSSRNSLELLLIRFIFVTDTLLLPLKSFYTSNSKSVKLILVAGAAVTCKNAPQVMATLEEQHMAPTS